MPKNFNFRARPDLVGALLAGGVDAVSLANNHLMDYGAGGAAGHAGRAGRREDPLLRRGPEPGRGAPAAPRSTVSGMRVALPGLLLPGHAQHRAARGLATDTTPGVAGHAPTSR